jgi:hypothetical protein
LYRVPPSFEEKDLPFNTSKSGVAVSKIQGGHLERGYHSRVQKGISGENPGYCMRGQNLKGEGMKLRRNSRDIDVAVKMRLFRNDAIRKVVRSPLGHQIIPV